MKIIYLLVPLVLVMTLSACSAVRVSQDYDLDRPLPVMNIYQWQTCKQPKTGDVRVDNPLLDTRIRSAIDRVLGEKGFSRADADTPDFRVTYQFAIKTKIRSDEMGPVFGFGLGHHGASGTMMMNTGMTTIQYDQGFLVIDFIDEPGGELLWRGKGTRRLPEHMDPPEVEQVFNELVGKILAQFPPAAR